MTGWRVGFAHGPTPLIEAMTKIQQYSFVCAPHPAQWGALAAMHEDISRHVAAYRRKRDRLLEALSDRYAFAPAGGAFYLFAEAPGGSGTRFVQRAIEKNLLIIPGSVFSARDTHFRISYAASDATIEKGIAVLRELADTA